MPRLAHVLAGAFLLPVLLAQEPTRNNAGFGGVYLDFELDAQTGNSAHLGVAADPRTGRIYVSGARLASGQPHPIYEFDARGTLLGGFSQPAVHTATMFGIRDLEFDGQNLIGGSEAGISVFSVSGQLVNVVQAANGPRPIAQPIPATGLGIWVPRAIAFDRAGNAGNGSFLLGDFDGPIVEIDTAGTLLRSWPNQGWLAYGLAIDPVTGNVWVNSLPNAGELAELDRQTMTPTGRSLPQIIPGELQGGLSLASPVAGHHAPWGVAAALIQLTQGPVDRVGVHRLHRTASVLGWDEPQLRLATNGGLPVPGNVPFGTGDSLVIELVDPLGVRAGQPCWTLLNFYSDATIDGVTNLGALVPGAGVLPECRALNALSQPVSTTFAIAAHRIGTAQPIGVPAGFPVAAGDVLRWQSLYLDPGNPNLFAVSNEAHFVGIDRPHGIVVRAEGPNSFQGAGGTPFWSVVSDSSHPHGNILRVEFSFVGASGPAAPHQFDLDQDNMDDRFDGGNATASGCRGTYRNGTDALCGLDYQAPGVHVNPTCHTAPGQSSGVVLPIAPTVDGTVPELVFHFTNFSAGKAFEFDCDTDGGLPSGDQHAGMIVRIATQNSGLLTGVLRVDPDAADRAIVWFP